MTPDDSHQTYPSAPAHRCAEPSPTTPTTDQFLTEVWDDDSISTEEHFPTAPLNDDIWTKDPIPDRQLCIHETSQLNTQCFYPCPYTNLSFGINVPQSPPWDTAVFGYEIMDLRDISSDIMTTSSDDDIPDLEDISDCLDNFPDWFA